MAAWGPWANTLTHEELMTGLRDMMTVRSFDARMLMAQRQGKTSFFVQSFGEEAVACGFQQAMHKGDMNFPTYRQVGLLISQQYPLIQLMNQIYLMRKIRFVVVNCRSCIRPKTLDFFPSPEI